MENQSTIPVEAQPFTKVDDYTTFYCEYTFKGDHIHFHFFHSPESAEKDATYWRLTFPRCLDAVARGFFSATYPQLQASLVEGVLRHGADPDTTPEDSWWFLAGGFANVPDPNLLVTRFLEELDQVLDKVSRT